MRCAHGQAGDRRVDHVDTGVDSALQVHSRQSCGGVSVQVDGNLDDLFDFLNQRTDHLGRQQPRHVFDANNIRPHIFQLLGHLHVQFQVVDRADRITDGAFYGFAAFLNGVDRHLDISEIVEGIKDTKNIDSYINGFLDEPLHDVVGVMPIPDAVLAAQEHLKGRVGHPLFELARPFPRVFIQKPDAGIESGAAPHFQRIVTDFIQLLRNRQHILRLHSSGKQRLMRVPQYEFGYFKRFGCRVHGKKISSSLPFTGPFRESLNFLDEAIPKKKQELWIVRIDRSGETPARRLV